MNMFIFQTFLLIAIAFILGCLIGYFLRLMFGGNAASDPAPIASTPAETNEKPEPKSEQAAPVSAPTSAIVKPASGDSDNLKQINGIGPVIEKKLNAVGISTFRQIADLTPDQVREIGEKLVFSGRIEREDWIGQAKKLVSGK